jgi:L-lysine exporter family protein LysE/ArgO
LSPVTPFLNGLFLGASLIIAIGAQNAFVLRQGLMRAHVFPVALVCALSDALLISIGVFALGLIRDILPGFETAAKWGGAAFLAVYAVMAARRAFASEAMVAGGGEAMPLLPTLLVCLGFTLLNPHVYLDTVVLVGSIGSQYPGETRPIFAFGAATASFLWFFGLGYGARLLTPVFARPMAWRVLDGIIALVMATLAASLVLG